MKHDNLIVFTLVTTPHYLILFILVTAPISNGVVELTYEGSTLCGSCVDFTCIANDTNIVSILNEGRTCQGFERGGPTSSNICSDLEITVKSTKPDTKHPSATDFAIAVQQCFVNGTSEINVGCVDSTNIPDETSLKVNSSSCAPLPNISSCSKCATNRGIAITVPVHCLGIENVTSLIITNTSGYIYNYSVNTGCFCVTDSETYNVSVVNQCGEQVSVELSYHGSTITDHPVLATVLPTSSVARKISAEIIILFFASLACILCGYFVSS